MNAIENTQPEEHVENTENTERVEDQALEDAAHEPGARVEETQSYQQAEIVEDTLVQSVEMVDVEKQESLAIQPGGDDGGEAATPIVIPGLALTPEDVKEDVALDHTGPGDNVAESPAPGGTPPGPNVEEQVAHIDHWSETPEPGGNPPGPNQVGEVPDPIPEPEPEDRLARTPDDVKLEPAPDFEAMNVSEQAVVEIISKAISDEDFRHTLLTDTPAAMDGYQVAESEQAALGEMQAESFDFFTAEVEARLSDLEHDEAAQNLKQVVHAVWRDLNPGSLAYVLAYKIPQKTTCPR